MTAPLSSIVFMGTPEFARVSLHALWEAGYRILAVVSQPDKPAGRGKALTSPACAVFAKEKKIPLFQPPKIRDEDIIQRLESLHPDFIVVAAYGKLLPKKILEIPKIEIVNIHASLLPSFRGAAPIQWCIVQGEKESGVSIMRVVEKMDAGPVYSRKAISLDAKETGGSLTVKLAGIGAELLLQTLPQIATNRLKPAEQDESLASTAPQIKKEDGRIQWDKPSVEIDRLIRGFNPWPSAHTSIDNKTLKIYDADLLPDKTDAPPGTVYFLSEKGIHVACRDSAICLTQVQLEGKKQMRASEFVRGYRLEVGAKFQ